MSASLLLVFVPLVLLSISLSSTTTTTTTVHAFGTVSQRPMVIRPLKRNHPIHILKLSSSSSKTSKNNNDSDDESWPFLQKYNKGRVGGRRNKQGKPRRNNKKSSLWSSAASIIPIMIISIWILLKSFLGGGESAKGNYYYYQSSVYESQIIGTNGKEQKIRKESIRTNVPSSLMMKTGQQQRPGVSTYDNSRLSDQEFDKELSDMIQGQTRAFFNEFF